MRDATSRAAFRDHDVFEDDSILLAVSSDLAFDGRLTPHRLIVTRTSVASHADGEPARLLSQVTLADVQSFRVCAGLGSGMLQARVDDCWVDLIRYSNSQAHRFVKLANRLEDFRESGELETGEGEHDDCRCPGCGLLLNFAGDVCPRCIDRGAVVSRVWKLMRPYRWPTLAICALVLLGVAVDLTPPKLQEYLVDNVLRVGAAHSHTSPAVGEHGGGSDLQAGDLLTILLLLVVTLAATRLVLALVNTLKGVLANRVGTAMTSELRGQMVAKLHSLPVDHYDRYPVGVLMSRVAHDTEALYGLIHQFTSGFLLQIVQVIGVGVMLFTLNTKLALWTLIPMPLVLCGSWFFWRFVYPKHYRYWDSASKQAGTLAGMLSGIRVVKAFAQEEREYRRFQKTSQALQHSRLEVEVSASFFSSVMQLVFSLGGLIVWFVGGKDVLSGEMTLGALMAFLAYLTIFYAPLTTLAQLTTWLTSFLTASQRVFELLDTPNRITDAENPLRLPDMNGRIEFEDVTFGYDRHRPVLKNFNLIVPAGQVLGVVGRSGSGKTTLVNLLSRFYDIDSGRVTIDGRDLRKLASADLRRQVGVVLQEPFLFRGTVWENLIYGRPDARTEDALAAARGANAHDFVMRLPLGYDTPLGERGAGLSGGEKQRLSIARALLYNPRILILDEATSSVDTESEKAIQDALAVLTRGRTTIAIAHRLSTLRNADRILVMENGKVLEDGTHEDLMAQDGLYARLVRIQTQVSADAVADEEAVQSASRGEWSATSANHGKSRPSLSVLSSPFSVHHSTQSKNRSNGPIPEGRKHLADFAPRWLTPKIAHLGKGEHGSLELRVEEDLYRGLFAVRALPATCPEEFISLRYADEDGQDHEAGMIRRVGDWPPEIQKLLVSALARHYFIREIEAIESIVQQYGLLDFQVYTNRGPVEFTIRSNHSSAQDFGARGKLLIDVDDNRFLVRDIDALPRKQQALFRRYIYW
jgi:ATP-binding cassette subfamily B protein